MNKSRTIQGVVHHLYGGYVTYNTSQRDPADRRYYIRTQLEVHVWMVPDFDESDCGYGTDKLVAALKAKTEKMFKRDREVEVRESWKY